MRDSLPMAEPPADKRGTDPADPDHQAGPAEAAEGESPVAVDEAFGLDDDATAGRPVLRVELSTRTVVVTLAATTALVVAIGVVRQAPEGLTLLTIGGFLGLALDPLVTSTARALRISRRRSGAVVLLTLAVITTAFCAVVAPQLAEQTASLPDQVPEVAGSLTSLPLVGPTLAENDVPAKVQDFVGTIPERLAGSGSAVAEVAGSIGAGAFRTLIALAVAVAVAVDGPHQLRRIRQLIPVENRSRADDLGRVAYDVLARYFVGNLLQAAAHGVWVAAWGVALGVPLTPVLAVWATITSMIPQIGGFLGFVLVVAVSLTQGLTTAVIMGVAFFAFMTFANNVLLPVLVGRAVDVSAPVTMLGAIAGFAVAGVSGSLLAIPVIGAVKAVALSLRGELPERERRDSVPLRDRWQRLRLRVRRLLPHRSG
jgi:predicted PurR-regulated permease PerM